MERQCIRDKLTLSSNLSWDTLMLSWPRKTREERFRFVNWQSVSLTINPLLCDHCWKSSGRLLHRKREIPHGGKPAGLPRSTISQSTEGISLPFPLCIPLFFFVSRISRRTIIVVKIWEGSRGLGFSSTDSIYIPGSLPPSTGFFFLSSHPSLLCPTESIHLFLLLFLSLFPASFLLSRSFFQSSLTKYSHHGPFYGGSILRENR